MFFSLSTTKLISQGPFILWGQCALKDTCDVSCWSAGILQLRESALLLCNMEFEYTLQPQKDIRPLNLQ